METATYTQHLRRVQGEVEFSWDPVSSALATRHGIGAWQVEKLLRKTSIKSNVANNDTCNSGVFFSDKLHIYTHISFP